VWREGLLFSKYDRFLSLHIKYRLGVRLG